MLLLDGVRDDGAVRRLDRDIRNSNGRFSLFCASIWKRRVISCTAISAAISPPWWPPMPSAITMAATSLLYEYPTRSSLPVPVADLAVLEDREAHLSALENSLDAAC
jgi:hypothetical protein